MGMYGVRIPKSILAYYVNFQQPPSFFSTDKYFEAVPFFDLEFLGTY